MMAFPSMLIPAADRAGMKHPPAEWTMVGMGATSEHELDEEGPNPWFYPHFFVFCQVQLFRSVKWGEHWDNAKVVAEIPMTNIRQVKLKELMTKGLQYST